MHKRRIKRKFRKLVFLIFFVIIVVFLISKYPNIFSKNKFLLNNNLEKNELKNREKLIENNEVKDSIFKKYYNKARSLVSKMTIEEKIGQLFLVRYNKDDVEHLSNFYPGGYILFAKDFQNNTKESMLEEINNDQKLNKYPLILGVDEEGGYVTRVSRFSAYRTQKFLSPREYYLNGGYPLLEKTENEKANLLKSLGINLNLAPVADVSTNSNDFIYSRSFGEDSIKTSEFVANMVRYANNNKINSCLKHFPGYGNNVDTHNGIAIDNRSYEDIANNDYKPFIAGIKENVPCILVSHNIVKSIDEVYPASLSKNVHDELRKKLNFTGIIMTDDLAMDAVKEYVDGGTSVTLAINSGNDMIITSDFVTMKNEALTSFHDGKIKEATINEAATRVIAWKYYSGLFNNGEVNINENK